MDQLQLRAFVFAVCMMEISFTLTVYLPWLLRMAREFSTVDIDADQ